MITIALTPAQRGLLDIDAGSGSESYERMVGAGVTWTRSRLYVPDTVAGRETAGFYIGRRAEIAEDTLGSPAASERGEARAWQTLKRKAREAGLPVESRDLTRRPEDFA